MQLLLLALVVVASLDAVTGIDSGMNDEGVMASLDEITGDDSVKNDEGCTDESESCRRWAAEGMCTLNPYYMKSKCAAACKVCGDEGCTDEDESCRRWAAEGECTRNPSYMVKNCAAACKICGGCTDENKKCRRWAARGECTRNPSYMVKNCAAACKICGDHSSLSTLMSKALNGLNQTGKRDDLAKRWNDAVENTCLSGGTCSGKFNDFAVYAQQIGHGLIAGKEIADGIGKMQALIEPTKQMGELIQAYAPFLGAFSAVVSIVGLFGSSPELQHLNHVINILNEGFSRMEYRFDSLEGKMEDIDRTIKQAHFWTRARPYLQDLAIVEQKIQDYFAVTDKIPQLDIASTSTLLGRSEWDAVYKAFEALRNDFKGVIDYNGKTTCEEVTEFMNVDRRKVVQILVNLYSRMVKGAMNLILIGTVMGYSDMSVKVTQYTERLNEIGTIIKKCDETIKTTAWLDSWKGDLETAMGDTKAGHESWLANTIYKALTDKYYWRDWLVVVYPEMIGSDNHFWQVQGIENNTSVNHVHWKDRYNIIVSSISADAPSRPWSGTIKTQKSETYLGRQSILYLDAKGIKEELPQTENYRIVVVALKKFGRFQVRAPENRMFHKVVTVACRRIGPDPVDRCERQGIHSYNVAVLGQFRNVTIPTKSPSIIGNFFD